MSLGLAYQIRPEVKIPQTFKVDTIPKLTVEECIKKHRIKFSYIALAQAKLESGNRHNSNLAEKSNNILGLRVAAQRYTFATNYHDYGSFAEYESVEDCIKDYKAWQIQNAFFITTEEQYLALLEKVYCKDPGYVKQLKKLIQ